jgi:hypothetical protein
MTMSPVTPERSSEYEDFLRGGRPFAIPRKSDSIDSDRIPIRTDFEDQVSPLAIAFVIKE